MPRLRPDFVHQPEDDEDEKRLLPDRGRHRKMLNHYHRVLDEAQRQRGLDRDAVGAYSLMNTLLNLTEYYFEALEKVACDGEVLPALDLMEFDPRQITGVGYE